MSNDNDQPQDANGQETAAEETHSDGIEAAVGSMTPEEMRAASKAATATARVSMAVAEGDADRNKPRDNTLLQVNNLKMYFPVTSGIIFPVSYTHLTLPTKRIV